MKKQYYYIIAGLPALGVNTNELPFELSEFRDQMKEQLSPEDRELFNMMLTPIDNSNLIRLLTQQKEAFNPDGNYSIEELATGIDMPELLPDYMQAFLETYASKSDQLSPMELESRLLDFYVDRGPYIKNKFLREWFAFDSNIRNMLAALNCRKFSLDLEQQVKGNTDISEIIRKNKEKDFGLGGVLPYSDQLVSFFDQENLLVREFGLEQLKWDKLDELTADYTFSIEIILAYVAKIRLIQRSLQMPEDQGKQKLDALLTDILAEYKLPETFA